MRYAQYRVVYNRDIYQVCSIPFICIHLPLCYVIGKYIAIVYDFQYVVYTGFSNVLQYH